MVTSEEDHADAGISRTPPTNQTREEPRAATSPDAASDLDMEIERLRRNVATPPPTIPVTTTPTIPAHDVYNEPNIDGDRRSPARRDDMTPVSAQKFKSASVSTVRTNIETGTVQTPDLTPPGAPGLVIETPIFDTFPSSGFSDTHQLINSAETEVSLYVLS